MRAFESELVGQAVNAPADAVYAFASRMENLPQWASGLAAGIEQRNGDWYTQSPMGEVKVAMAPANAFGVLDHDVTLPDGTTVHNAFRVTPSGEGSLLVFVVLHLPGVDQQRFDADVAHVRKDLLALKAIMESAA
jgi:hypothetical protein